jgi:hypothetical protein
MACMMVVVTSSSRPGPTPIVIGSIPPPFLQPGSVLPLLLLSNQGRRDGVGCFLERRRWLCLTDLEMTCAPPLMHWIGTPPKPTWTPPPHIFSYPCCCCPSFFRPSCCLRSSSLWLLCACVLRSHVESCCCLGLSICRIGLARLAMEDRSCLFCRHRRARGPDHTGRRQARRRTTDRSGDDDESIW